MRAIHFYSHITRHRIQQQLTRILNGKRKLIKQHKLAFIFRQLLPILVRRPCKIVLYIFVLFNRKHRYKLFTSNIWRQQRNQTGLRCQHAKTTSTAVNCILRCFFQLQPEFYEYKLKFSTMLIHRSLGSVY